MFERNGPKISRVFLYLRKSTEESSERQIRSIGDQRRDCEKVAERYGLKIVQEYTESKSARKPHQRAVFRELLKQLSFKNPVKRRAEGILAWHPNRLSRNALEAGMLVQMLDDELIKDMFFAAYSFHNDTSGKEHLAIEFARAKGYTDQLSDVVSRGIKSREATGAMMYPIKYGYVKKREHEKAEKCSLFPVPHDVQFNIVVRAFALALDGRGTRNIIEYLKDEFGGTEERIPSLPSMDRILRDPFYKGQWSVLTGTKDERVTDLTKITLPDGTGFTAAVSDENFQRVQEIRSGRVSAGRQAKRLNPLPRMVVCGACSRHMYATYRKITRAGGRKEEQLGYECQTKGCTQSRFKAEILFGYVAEEIRVRTAELDKRSYQRYVLAVKLFVKQKRKDLQTERGRILKAIQDLTRQRNSLIETKAKLVREGSYDSESQMYFDEKILELGGRIKNISDQKKGLKEGDDEKLTSFVQFLELSQNLHHYWVAANYKQKEQISKNLLLNLVVSGSAIRSGSWLQPFANTNNLSNLSYGRAQEKKLEPDQSKQFSCIQTSWEWATDMQNADVMTKWGHLFEALASEVSPKFLLCRDIG